MGICQSTNTVVDGGRKPASAAPTVTTAKSPGAANQSSDSQIRTSNGASGVPQRESADLTNAANTNAAPSDSSSRPRFASYASGASTPDCHSDNEDEALARANDENLANKNARFERKLSNPKCLTHSASKVGLDEMIEDRREMGDIRQNVVHIEVPFGKPIEEVYDGIHSGPVLGSGISGLVRLATHKATGLKYAVKVLDLGLVDTAVGLQQLREEIFIMCQLDHPNIVRLEEVYESHNEIYLVQELCLGGELFDRLDEQPDYHYTEGECARLVKQMLSAVRYLHSKGIIHRDLKLENFLFSSTSKDSELKMIDFGLSKHFRYGEVHHEAVGTPYTVSPEVIRGSYDERCDVWAIGVITFLLLSGDPPFGGCGGPEPLMQVRANILSGTFRFEPKEIWANTSSLARSFICDLLKTDPKDRPTARKAQTHAWLQEWANRGKIGKDNALNPNVVKALVNFKEFSDMRKLLCEVLSFTLLPYQIKDLRREFEKMDTDGSGEISLSALKQVLVTNAGAGSLGALTEEEVEDIFNAMRVRKSETRIHWHEFIAAGLSQCQVDDRNLRLAFDRLDSDHKGYIVPEDIMDLMGSDSSHSEEEMLQMWGDSVKAVKCGHARITYDDFLLLMKGQAKETPIKHDVVDTTAGTSILVQSVLHPVLESNSETLESPTKSEATADEIGLIHDESRQDPSIPVDIDTSHAPESHISTETSSTTFLPKPAPKTPSYHKKTIDDEKTDSVFSMDDGPLSMDEDFDIAFSIPGVAGLAASLTPPMSPARGPRDYVTPSSNRTLIDFMKGEKNLALPGLGMVGVEKPPKYTRLRSRSLEESEQGKEKEKEDGLHFVADVVRDMLIPEHDHSSVLSRELEEVKDETKSTLVVNRKLYRAHRQMRLAVLEASKRFEEQQTEHARQLIIAAREAEGSEDKGLGMIQAGLVMRHGHTKQVSSKDIRNMLAENQAQQQLLVEQANRRGGRGRHSRKKTTSDISKMLGSVSQDDLTKIAIKAAELDSPAIFENTPIAAIPESEDLNEDFAELVPAEGTLRGATVPGEFRTTSDPFSSQGKYGAVIPAWS